MRFKGNFKTAAIAALGLLLLATVAGLAISALTTVRDATEGTPAEFVGVSAEVVAGPVTAMVAVAPTSPIDATAASANSNAPPLVASVSGTRSENGKQIAASWTAASDATHYSLNYYVHDGNDQWFRYTDDIVGTSFTMTGLRPTYGYTIAIQSVKRVGEDVYAYGWTNSDEIEAPAPPDLVDADSIEVQRSENGEELKIKWAAVADATHYHLNYTDDDGDSWQRYESDIPASDIPASGSNDWVRSMKDLDDETLYTLAVQSVRKVEDASFAYGWVNVDVHAPPGKPRDLAASTGSSGSGGASNTVYWTIPEFLGTGPNTAGNQMRFNISCMRNDGSWFQAYSNETFTPIAGQSPPRYAASLGFGACSGPRYYAYIAATNVVTGLSSSVEVR